MQRFLFSGSFLVASIVMAVSPLQKQLATSDQHIEDRKPREALAVLETLSDTSADTLWRLSRAHAIIGELEQDSQKQKQRYETALTLAEKAVEADAKSAWAHLRLATAAGKIALFKGPLSAKDLVNQVRSASKTGIELAGSDKTALSFGHYLLGRAHLKLTKTPYVIRKPLGLAWGKLSKAKTHLEKATQLLPKRILNQLALAQVYQRLKEKDRALKHARIAAQLPPVEVGDEKRIEEAKALIDDN